MTEIEAATELFSQAAVLMMVGMGFVFAFLSLLILVIKFLISPLATRFPDPVEPAHKDSSHQPTAVIAAISVAINKYRKNHALKK